MKSLWRIIPLILLWLFSSGSALGFFGLTEKSASGEFFSEITFCASGNNAQSQYSCPVDVPHGYDCVVESILWTHFDPQGLMTGGGGAEYMRGIQDFHEVGGNQTVGLATVALPVAAYMGPVGVAKEAASEGFEQLTGIPTSIKDVPSLAKKGWKGLKNLFGKKKGGADATKTDSIDAPAQNSSTKSQAEVDANAQQTEQVKQANGQSGQSADVDQSATETVTLNQQQQSAVRKMNNAVDDHLTDMDISGAVADQMGSPIPKPSGGYWDHTKEVDDALRGARKNADKLRNVDNQAAQEAVQKADEAVNKAEEAIQGAGI